MASIKIERLNSTYQEVISLILAREVKDEGVKFVTITGVDVTSDLSFAYIYYTVLDDSRRDSTAKALERAKPFIRKRLADEVDVRHTPELIFRYDTSEDYGNHIDKIIDEINKKGHSN